MENNYINETYGNYKIISKDEERSKEKRKQYYWCQCKCGSPLKSVNLCDLKRGATKSCGCYKKERESKIEKKGNIYDLSGEYGIVYDSKGRFGYFDLKNYEKIKAYTWRVDNIEKYLVTTFKKGTILMHRLIMDCPEGMVVDHINGYESRNDNREENLRVCTQGENLRNNNGKGYYWDKSRNKWLASIQINGKGINLGRYDTEEEAREVRIKAEQELFGKYAPIR